MALLPEDTSGAQASTEPIHEQKRDVSGYIADMTRNLKELATNADLAFLGYLLSIAEEEARGVHRAMRAPAVPPLAAIDRPPVPDEAATSPV